MAKKKSEKLSDKEVAERVALAKHDMAVINKEIALKPFTMNQPYNLNLKGEQMQWLLKQDVMSNFAKGCILMEVKERENAQTFAHFREEVCGGMGQRIAETYMLFSKKCVELKNITAFGEKNWSKVITLLHGTTEEQLKEIEEKGIDGKSLDEFDGMSVRDFKRLLKTYKHDTDKVIKAETHTLKVERDSLVKENTKLKAQVESVTSPKAMLDVIANLDKIFMEFERKIQVVFCPALHDDLQTQAKIINRVDDMKSRIMQLGDRLDSFIGEELG